MKRLLRQLLPGCEKKPEDSRYRYVPVGAPTIYLSLFTMILLLVHPSLLYQCLCIFLSASLIGSLLGLGNPNDRAPLVTF